MNIDVHLNGQFIRNFEADSIDKDESTGDILCYIKKNCERILIASIPNDHFVLITNPNK